MVSGTERKEILDQIEEAFKVLSDPELKNKYDSQVLNIDYAKNQNQRETGDFVLRSSNKPTETVTSKPITKSKDQFEQHSIKKLIETNKYQLNFEVNEDFERTIRESTNFDGNFLKKIREYKQVSVEKMSEMTRVSKGNIKNIELENTDPLPALVYVRGFVYQYAKCLKLNPELVASSYIHQLKKKQEKI